MKIVHFTISLGLGLTGRGTWPPKWAIANVLVGCLILQLDFRFLDLYCLSYKLQVSDQATRLPVMLYFLIYEMESMLLFTKPFGSSFQGPWWGRDIKDQLMMVLPPWALIWWCGCAILLQSWINATLTMFSFEAKQLVVCSRPWSLLSMNHKQIFLKPHHPHYERHYWFFLSWVEKEKLACSHRA